MKEIEDFITKYGSIYQKYDLNIYYINDPLYADNLIGIQDIISKNRAQVNLTNFQIHKLSLNLIFENLIKDIGRFDAINYVKRDITTKDIYKYYSIPPIITDPTRTFVLKDDLSEKKSIKLDIPKRKVSDTIWYLNINKKVSARLYYEYENSYIFKLLTNTNYWTLSKLDCEYLDIPYEDNLLITHKNKFILIQRYFTFNFI